MVAKSIVAADYRRICCMAVLIGRAIIDIGIIVKRFHVKIGYLDGPRHFNHRPSFIILGRRCRDCPHT